MKEYLDLLLRELSRIFDAEISLFACVVISVPFILGLLGPTIELFEKGKPQKLTRKFLRRIFQLLMLFRERKLRPAKEYFAERLATIRTLF